MNFCNTGFLSCGDAPHINTKMYGMSKISKYIKIQYKSYNPVQQVNEEHLLHTGLSYCCPHDLGWS